MSDKSWKRAERMIAKDCRGQRIPVTGERNGADVQHPLFAFQVKVRRALPAWIFDWLDGICSSAKRTNRIGVLILNRPRSPRRNALVVLRWADWIALHGDLKVGDFVESEGPASPGYEGEESADVLR